MRSLSLSCVAMNTTVGGWERKGYIKISQHREVEEALDDESDDDAVGSDPEASDDDDPQGNLSDEFAEADKED